MNIIACLGAAAVLTATIPDIDLSVKSQDGAAHYTSKEFSVSPGEYLVTGEIRTDGRCSFNSGAKVQVKFPGKLPSLWHAGTVLPQKTDGRYTDIFLTFRVTPGVDKAQLHFWLENFHGKANFRNFKVERLADVSPYRVFKSTAKKDLDHRINLLPSKVYIASADGCITFYNVPGNKCGRIDFVAGQKWRTPDNFASSRITGKSPQEIREIPNDPDSFNWRVWNSHTMTGLSGKGSMIREFELEEIPDFAVARICASGADVIVNRANFGRNNGKVVDGAKWYINFKHALKKGKNVIELRYVHAYPNQVLTLDAEMIFPDGRRQIILASDGKWRTNGKPLEFNTSPYRGFHMYDKPWLQPPEMPESMYNIRRVSSRIELDHASVPQGGKISGKLLVTPKERLLNPFDKVAVDILYEDESFCWRTWGFAETSLRQTAINGQISIPFVINTSVIEPGKYILRPRLPGASDLMFQVTSGKRTDISKTVIDFSRCIPALNINGTLHPATVIYSRNFYDPLRYGRHAELDYNQFAKTGVQIISSTAELGTDQEKGASIRLGSIWNEADKFDYSRLDADIRRVLSGAPDTKTLLMLSCDVPLWMKKAYPEDLIKLSDGSVHHSMSMASDRWANDTAAALKNVTKYLMEQPYRDRIIGIFLISGFDGQWLNYHNFRQVPWIYGDYSAPAVAAFRKFLRSRYGNDVKKLRKAWNNDSVSFENAAIPTQQERLDESVYYPEPLKNIRKIDYYEFLGELTSLRINQFCKSIKDVSGNRWIVGTYYIADHGETSRQGQELRQEGREIPEAMDFAAQPQQYDNRELHNIGFTQNGISRTFANAKKLWMVEDDNRTFMIDYPVPRWGNYTVHGTVASTVRHIGQRLTLFRGHWFFDIMGNFFATPVMNDLISWENRIEKAALEFAPLPELRTQAVEIKVHRHLNHKRLNTHKDLAKLHFYSLNDYVSYPVDNAEINDLSHPDMPDYRLYIFRSQFFMDAAARKKIEELKKPGKTLLFTGDTGLSDGKTLSAENISKLTGIRVKDADNGTDHDVSWQFADKTHWLTAGSAKAEWAMTRFSHRRFEICDPDAEIIGYYPDGKPAAAVKKINDCTVIYIPATRPDIPLVPYIGDNIARHAGFHAFMKSGDPLVIRAGGRFVSVYCPHNTANSVIALPKGVEAVELLSGKKYAGDVKLTMSRGESKIFFCGTVDEVNKFSEKSGQSNPFSARR